MKLYLSIFSLKIASFAFHVYEIFSTRILYFSLFFKSVKVLTFTFTFLIIEYLILEVTRSEYKIL